MRSEVFGIAFILFITLLCISCPADPEQPKPIPSRDQSDGKGRVQVGGKVMSKSDVSSIPDVPIPSGLVFAVSMDGISRLSKRFPQKDWKKDSFRRIEFEIASPHDYTEFAVADSVIEADGSYSFALSPGDYVIFLANTVRTDNKMYPVRIVGGFKWTFSQSRGFCLDIFRGIGGVYARER